VEVKVVQKQCLKEIIDMNKNYRMKIMVYNKIIMASTLVALLSVQVSWPWRIFQEQVPECLLEKQD